MAEIPYVISRDVIRRLAISMHLNLDERAWAFLERTTSCRVLAAPGSGKTTLLVLKLLAIADAWRSSGCGVLVLSHTNVARAQVEQRLSEYPAAAGILRYPHFIGTFQTFVDRFIAVPHLRCHGLSTTANPHPDKLVIDDDEFGRRAIRLLNSPEFRIAFNWCQQGFGRELLVSSLRFLHDASSGLQIDCSGLPAATSNTTRQLVRLKERLAADGVFRYSDMFAIAEHALSCMPQRLCALRARFPVVFIDETQDNGCHVEQFLKLLFGDDCVVQRLGDPNQAIFESDVVPPSASADIDLKCSHRFGCHVASIATRLTTRVRQDIQGMRTGDDSDHSVFLFNDSTIDRVLPAFGDLTFGKWGIDAPHRTIAALAMRIRKDDRDGDEPGGNPRSRKGPPYSACDYWPSFVPDESKLRTRGQTLADAVILASGASRRVNGGRYVYRVCLAAVRDMHHHATGTWLSQNDLLEYLTSEQHQALRDACVTILHGDSTAGIQMLATMGQGFCVERRASLDSYLDASSVATSGVTGSGALALPHGSIYKHAVGGVQIPIRLSSIHAVKGETHDATLVLESFNRTHDLKDALPYITGKKTALDLDPTPSQRVRNLFVAMTRPRHLLCIAMHIDHLGKKGSQLLANSGWQVVDLTN